MRTDPLFSYFRKAKNRARVAGRLKRDGALLLCFLFLGSHAFAQEEPQKLGDGNDGSRSGPVHVITLYDEKGLPIDPNDERPRPVSMRNTCGECHDYEKISHGWHFHSGMENPPAGRPGEPWVLFDSGTRTQIPISNRGWEGAYKPAEVGLTPWKFLKEFASHFPGGNYGEMSPAEDDENADPEEVLRWPISGHYEINCLACHNADRRQDQSDGALQAARENYRWVATVASGLATVTGTASALDMFYDPETQYEIETVYDKTRFNADNKVFLDIVRHPPANRCYFCHSVQDMQVSEERDWTREEDIHLTSGMTCVDCHRNGDDHMITRGDVEHSHGDPDIDPSFSCRGCHLGDETASDPALRKGGHLSAPVPKHEGIPTIHFSILTCTACHSGPLPEQETGWVRTSRIHKLGLHGKHHVDLMLPHVESPVFVRGEDGRIAPHRLFWPSFWGTLTDEKVTPLNPDFVEETTGDELNPDTEERVNDWKPLTREQIVSGLKAVGDSLEAPAEGEAKPEPVYVAGGKLYRVVEEKLVEQEHPAAEAYSWPLAHNVRPAAQSLGANGKCSDCHDTRAPFLFASVSVDSPVVSDEGAAEISRKEMVEFENLDRGFAWLFAFSFLFRPWMKVVVLLSCAALGLILLAFGVKAVGCLAKGASERNDES